MEGWKDEWMEGRKDERMEGSENGRKDGRMEGRMEGRKKGEKEGKKCRKNALVCQIAHIYTWSFDQIDLSLNVNLYTYS